MCLTLMLFYSICSLSCPICNQDPYPNSVNKNKSNSNEASSTAIDPYGLLIRDLVSGDVIQDSFKETSTLALESAKVRCEIVPSEIAKTTTPLKNFSVNCFKSETKEVLNIAVDCKANPPQKTDYFKNKLGMASVMIVASCLE
ncbi:MAG: hypothetical protein NT027_13525 [Proteobacteria bacterium]|nr:hypothetical protein [Pseudomonadota bacterium]